MNRIIYIITFFIYFGYNAVLVILMSLNMSKVSRTITIPLRLVMTLLMIYVIVKLYKEKSSLGIKAKNILFSVFVFWVLYFIKVFIHYGFNHEMNKNWFEYIFYALNFCLFPFMLFIKLDFSFYKNIILKALLFSGFLMGLFTLYVYKNMLLSGISRISLAIYHDKSIEDTISPITLSYSGSLVIILCFYLFFFKWKTFNFSYKLYLMVNFFLGFVMFFLGASRGSIIAIVFCIPVFYSFSSIKKKVSLFIALAGLVPIVIWGALKTGSSVFERVSKIGEKGGSTSERLMLWKDALDEFSAHPIIGGRIEIDYYPHNIIFEILMSLGVLGLILFLYFLFNIIRIGLRKVSMDRDYLWVLLIFIQGFVQSMFSGALYTTVLIFFSAGLLLSDGTKTNVNYKNTSS